MRLAFDFEWTNATIMFRSYQRTTSFFENSDMKAVGSPSSGERKLLEPFRSELPASVFSEPYVPPVSDGSVRTDGSCAGPTSFSARPAASADGSVLKLPNGRPLEIEFLDFQPSLQPHAAPSRPISSASGSRHAPRIVDPAQYQRRMDEVRFRQRRALSRACRPPTTPSRGLRIRVRQEPELPQHREIDHPQGRRARGTDRNGGHPRRAQSRLPGPRPRSARQALLDSTMWFRASDWIAWDMYSRPETRPRFSSGARHLVVRCR